MSRTDKMILDELVEQHKKKLEAEFLSEELTDLENATFLLNLVAGPLSNVSYELMGMDSDYTIIVSVYVPNIYNHKWHTIIIDYIDDIKFDNLDELKRLLLNYEKEAEELIAHFNT